MNNYFPSFYLNICVDEDFLIPRNFHSKVKIMLKVKVNLTLTQTLIHINKIQHKNSFIFFPHAALSPAALPGWLWRDPHPPPPPGSSLPKATPRFRALPHCAAGWRGWALPSLPLYGTIARSLTVPSKALGASENTHLPKTVPIYPIPGSGANCKNNWSTNSSTELLHPEKKKNHGGCQRSAPRRKPLGFGC